MAKKIRVRYRKLGKEQAHAQCDDDKPNSIEVDIREKGRSKMKWKLHEALHIMFKKHSITFASESQEEKAIRSISNFQARVLWDNGYRKIEE